MIMKVEEGEYTSNEEYPEAPVLIVNHQLRFVHELKGRSNRSTPDSECVLQHRGIRYSFPANMAPIKTIAATIPTSMVVADGPPSDRGV